MTTKPIAIIPMVNTMPPMNDGASKWRHDGSGTGAGVVFGAGGGGGLLVVVVFDEGYFMEKEILSIS